MTWTVIESNPDVITKYIKELGVPSGWKFNDICGLDNETQKELPKPVVAVLFLHPKTSVPTEGTETDAPNLYFVHLDKEYSCGATAILHALINNKSHLNIKKDSILDKIIEQTKNQDPTKRGISLDMNKELQTLHESYSKEGQSKVSTERKHHHFVCFVENGGNLYELDSMKNKPILHGKCKPETLLEEASLVIKKICDKDMKSHNFSAVALTKE